MSKIFKNGDTLICIKTEKNFHITVGKEYICAGYDVSGIFKIDEDDKGIIHYFTRPEELFEVKVAFGKSLFGYKIKVKDEEQSRLIQEAVFEAGGKWCYDGKNYFEHDSEWPLVVDTNGIISTISYNIEERWEKHPLPELILETVKTLRIVDTIPVKTQAEIEKENLQKVIDKLQQDLDNAKQQLNSIGGK